MNHSKLFIASDIHGDAECTRLLLRRFDEEGADLCVLLGDLLYHGPRNDLPKGYAPKEVISLLNDCAEKILAVRGNCESEVDQMVLSFPVLAEYAVLFVDGRRFYLTHGHRHNADSPLPMAEGDIMLCGHTHIPAVTAFGRENLYLNPGSVSIPKEESLKSYMIYENGVFLWKKLETGEIYRSHRL